MSPLILLPVIGNFTNVGKVFRDTDESANSGAQINPKTIFRFSGPLAGGAVQEVKWIMQAGSVERLLGTYLVYWLNRRLTSERKPTREVALI